MQFIYTLRILLKSVASFQIIILVHYLIKTNSVTVRHSRNWMFSDKWRCSLVPETNFPA